MKFDVIRKIEDTNLKDVVICIFDGNFPKELNEFDKKYEKKLSQIIRDNSFDSKYGEIYEVPKAYLGDRYIYFVSLGKEKNLTTEKLRNIVGKTSKYLQEKKRSEYNIIFPKALLKKISFLEAVKLCVTSVITSTYHFDTYITNEKVKLKAVREVVMLFFASSEKKRISNAIKEGEITGNAINFTRTLGNLPPIEMTPTYMAKEAEKLGKKHSKLNVKVLNKSDIQKEKMGGLLGVASGSYEEPKFIVMEWKNAPKTSGAYIFVGKAITFDSGGLSIKPSERMDEMKFDMLGGGAVMGAMKAISELNLKINIVALIPSSENLLGSRAYRPGDILKSRSGKTIEVLNTDAEGRIILADALDYARQYNPSMVLDIATLTGACAVALGENYAGLFTRNDKLRDVIKQTAIKADEKIWELPLDDNFSDQIKSTIADVRNIGTSRYAGASTAAAFLEEFTDYPWAHIDIAGVGWTPSKPSMHGGATGYGVALLIELAKKYSK